MRLILFRHGPAEAREGYRGRDADRPLSEEGARRTRRALRGLSRWVPELRTIRSSPYRRAAETAEIASARFGISYETTEALRPGADPAELSDWLAVRPMDSIIMAVGHEPDLGELASWFLSGRSSSFAPVKKAGAVALDFSTRCGPSTASLAFAISGGQLRRLAGR